MRHKSLVAQSFLIFLTRPEERSVQPKKGRDRGPGVVGLVAVGVRVLPPTKVIDGLEQAWTEPSMQLDGEAEDAVGQGGAGFLCVHGGQDYRGGSLLKGWSCGVCVCSRLAYQTQSSQRRRARRAGLADPCWRADWQHAARGDLARRDVVPLGNGSRIRLNFSANSAPLRALRLICQQRSAPAEPTPPDSSPSSTRSRCHALQIRFDADSKEWPLSLQGN